MYKLSVWSTLLFPFIGIVLMYFSPHEYVWLTGGLQNGFPMAYYSLFIIGALAATLSFKKESFSVCHANSPNTARRIEYILFFIMLAILFLIYIEYRGFAVLAGELTKEDVRHYGFAHAILTKYLTPSIFAYICSLRRVNLITQRGWQLFFVVTVLIGLSTGGKAAVLIMLLPGLVILYAGGLKVWELLLGGIMACILLMMTAFLFDSYLDGDPVIIFNYIIQRSFELTAQAPYEVSIAYSENTPIIEYYYTLFEIFGKSVLSDFVPQQDLHKYLFSHAITAWLYPDNLDRIVSGTWNITPNVFSEALIVGGWVMLPVFGWLVVFGSYTLWALVVRLINRGNFTGAAVLSVYSVFVYISWINSAGIMQLVHPLAMGSLALSWFCLKTFARTTR